MCKEAGCFLEGHETFTDKFQPLRLSDGNFQLYQSLWFLERLEIERDVPAARTRFFRRHLGSVAWTYTQGEASEKLASGLRANELNLSSSSFFFPLSILTLKFKFYLY